MRNSKQWTFLLIAIAIILSIYLGHFVKESFFANQISTQGSADACSSDCSANNFSNYKFCDDHKWTVDGSVSSAHCPANGRCFCSNKST